jgi:hypothetical protein
MWESSDRASCELEGHFAGVSTELKENGWHWGRWMELLSSEQGDGRDIEQSHNLMRTITEMGSGKRGKGPPMVGSHPTRACS